MVLVVTNRGDLTADWLILELERRGAAFVRFNTEDWPSRARLVWRESSEAALELAGTRHPLSRFASVWYRRPVPPLLPAGRADALAGWSAGEAREALLGTWRTLDLLWVNHPDRNRVAESKLHQLPAAADVGLEVPATLVTNDADEARSFVAARPSGVVCKAIYSGRVPTGDGDRPFYTSLVDESAAPFDRLAAEPYLFQARVPRAADVRVTVIGGETFGVSISARSGEAPVDWRRAESGDLVHVREELPDDVAEACVRLVERYGLNFAAIDLIRRPDDSYAFLEINPNGEWAWLERETGLPLRARLADLLVAG